MNYEFCVMMDRYPNDPHRGPMPEVEARTWIEEWYAMPENNLVRKDMFYVARRPVGGWEKIEQ